MHRLQAAKPRRNPRRVGKVDGIDALIQGVELVCKETADEPLEFLRAGCQAEFLGKFSLLQV